MKKTFVILMAAVTAGLFFGCDSSSSQPPGAAAQKKYRIGFVARQANDYWSLVRFGCDTAVVTLGDVELDFRAPIGRTAAEQNQVFSNLVASGVQAIAISPIDGDEQTATLNAVSTNLLLVCADNDAEQSRRAAYIGTDNVAAGVQAAGLLKAALPRGGKVVMFVGSETAQNARERIQGLKRGLSGSNIEIIETQVDGMSAPVALQNAEKALATHADLAGMVGLYGYNGPAILAAVRSAGKAGKIQIVCFDTAADTLNGINAGEVYGTIAQNPFKIGNRTISSLVKYLRGDKTALAGGRVLIPSNPVTKENVEDYLKLSNVRARQADAGNSD